MPAAPADTFADAAVVRTITRQTAAARSALGRACQALIWVFVAAGPFYLFAFADDDHVDLRRRLKHPDPKVRSRLAESLPDVSQGLRRELTLELLSDQDSKVRVATLEALRSLPPDQALVHRVQEIAESDPAATASGYARLLAAEWSLGPHGAEPPRAFDDRGWAEAKPLPDRNVIDRPAAHRPGSPIEQAAFESPIPPPATHHPPPVSTSGANSATEPTPDPQPIEPGVLGRSIAPPPDFPDQPAPIEGLELLTTPSDAPLGYAGNSGVAPTESQEDSHFVPVEDRWRIGSPAWDRYKKGHPAGDDYPYVEGHWWDPYNLNVIKGDYPIIGQHTFLNVTGTVSSLHEFRDIPTPTTPFESTVDPFEEQFFGNPHQYFTTNFFRLSVNLFHGNGAFKPVDWQVKLTPVFNFNYLDVNELGIVNPDVRAGTTRFRDFEALEEWFVEAKLADLGPDYDFVSVRAGSQPFTSDFRGFIFSDTNRGIRLFGTRFSNRDQFNVIFFDQTEKDTNSQLNTFRDRHQNTLIANYTRQDFIFPGYSAMVNFHYNNDQPAFLFDKNNFLARPDPTGIFQPHRVQAYYFGLAGDGHIGKVNLTNAFYWVVGRDSNNPIGGRPQQIDAKMVAIEASVDRDWVRFRSSFFWASGDHNANDTKARGFDSIFDNPNFAGGAFSYWQRQQIPLFGTSLVNRFSLVPDLRSSKFQGQSNFVNPGLFLYNLGMDFEVTPKLRLITNANYLMFDSTNVLQTFTFQQNIDRSIGADLSLGIEYRPFLNDNVIFRGGVAALVPGRGFKDLFGATNPFSVANSGNVSTGTLFSNFVEMALTY